MPDDDAKLSSAVEQSAEPDDSVEEPFVLHGPIRRNLPLLSAVLAILVVGPLISRVIDNYRGIVLEVRDGEMLVAFNELPPKWISLIEVTAGDFVEKHAGSWGPSPGEQQSSDTKLLSLYARYIDTYEGVITEIIPPESPGGPSSAVIHTDEGRMIVMSIWDASLARAAKDRRVVKRHASWDPELLAP